MRLVRLVLLVLIGGLIPGSALAVRHDPHSSSVRLATDVIVFDDALGSDWENWSWQSTVNVGASQVGQTGTAALGVTYNAAWAGLYLHTATLLYGASYTHLRFRIHGGTSSARRVKVLLANETGAYGSEVIITPTAGTWSSQNIPLASLGSPNSISGIVIQEQEGSAQPAFYLDDVSLIGGSTPVQQIAIAINAGANRTPISPLIYGLNFADAALAAELRLPINRWGGNATTRYNWQNDTSNRASDYFFENIPNDNANPAALPIGSSTDRFVEQNKTTKTASLITVPLLGWTPKSRGYDCGFAVAKYGAQQQVDQWRPCGNGMFTNGTPITGNDPTDTSMAIGPSFVEQWIAHLIQRFGTAANGGVEFYNLDNEPMLWNSTHRDVHPQPTSYDEMRDRTLAYGAAVKRADSSAKTLGPAEWGWTNYFYSALDAAPGGAWWQNPQDRNAHGGTEFIAWYLQQLREYETTNGTRILDYLDLHYYPQAGGVALSAAGDAATQARRLRSTRGLWDPTFVDESWINEPVNLLPRMRQWVDQHYPGTKLAIGEYNWGGLEHINGALAQADVLGIFGRERLDLATMWSPPSSSQPGAFAFRMYRNYDGAGSGFGETSVAATSSDQSKVAVYAAQRSADNALTIMLINKTSASQTLNPTLAGLTPANTAQVYSYSAANLNAIVRQADLAISNSTLMITLPASSITLVVVPPSTPGTTPNSFVRLPLIRR